MSKRTRSLSALLITFIITFLLALPGLLQIPASRALATQAEEEETAYYPVTEIEPGKEATAHLVIKRGEKEISLADSKHFAAYRNEDTAYEIEYKKGEEFVSAYMDTNHLVAKNYTVKFTLGEYWAKEFKKLGVTEIRIKDIQIAKSNSRYATALKVSAVFHIKETPAPKPKPSEAPKFTDNPSDVFATGLSADKSLRWRIRSSQLSPSLKNKISYDPATGEIVATAYDPSISADPHVIAGLFDVSIESIDMDGKISTKADSVFVVKNSETQQTWNYLIDNYIDDGVTTIDPKSQQKIQYFVAGELPAGLQFDKNTLSFQGRTQENWSDEKTEHTYHIFVGVYQPTSNKILIYTVDNTISIYKDQQDTDIKIPLHFTENNGDDSGTKPSGDNKHKYTYDDVSAGSIRSDYFVTKVPLGATMTAKLHFVTDDGEDVTTDIAPLLAEPKIKKIMRVERTRNGKTETLELENPFIVNDDYSVTFVCPKDAQIGDNYRTPEDASGKHDASAVDTLVLYFKNGKHDIVYTNANFDIVAAPEPVNPNKPNPPAPKKPVPAPNPGNTTGKTPPVASATPQHSQLPQTGNSVVLPILLIAAGSSCGGILIYAGIMHSTRRRFSRISN